MMRRKLIEFRQALEITQRELGEAIGVTDMTISRWEHGRTTPPINYIPQIADALGLSIEDCVFLFANSKNPS